MQAPLLFGIEPETRQHFKLLIRRNPSANLLQQIVGNVPGYFFARLKRRYWCHHAASAAAVTRLDDGQRIHVELSYGYSWIQFLLSRIQRPRGITPVAATSQRHRPQVAYGAEVFQFPSAPAFVGVSDGFVGGNGAVAGISSTMTGVSRGGILPGQPS